jgi:hypothetical protein
MKIIIILGSIFSSLISLNLFASVEAFVDKNQFYAGDSVRLTISLSGKGASLPNLNKIGDYPVLGVSNSSITNIVNGKYESKISKIYTFQPTSDLIIPSFEIEVNGTIQKTNPIKIIKLTPSESKIGDDFVLSMQLNKNDFFVGESGKLAVEFKAKKYLGDFGSVNISPANAKGLDFETDNRFIKTTNKDYNIFTLNYDFKVNDFGEITIPSNFATISKTTGFGIFQTRSSTKKVYSNSLKISVKPLPDDLTIYGDFKIKFSVDKQSIENGEAVNGVIEIIGSGNFEDIEDFKINIENATIYSDKSQINGNKWTQKFAIVGESDFVIPSFEFDYFNKKTNNKETINTQKVNIKVVNSVKSALKNIDKNDDKNNNKTTQNHTQEITQKPQPKVVENIKTSDDFNKYYFLISGFIFGVIVVLLILWIKSLSGKKANKQTKSLINSIRFATNDKKLFDILLPLNLKELSEIMQKLEENIYKNSKNKIDKKAIIKIIKF